jgi:hypothetical protein
MDATEALKTAYSLKFPPSFVTPISVPKGTLILESRSSAASKGVGGTDQFELLEVNEKYFGGTEKLETFKSSLP